MAFALIAGALGIGLPVNSISTEVSLPGVRSAIECTEVLDLFIAVDQSTSVGLTNFSGVRTLLVRLLKDLPISRRGVHVGLLAFGDDVELRWGFKDAVSWNKEEAIEKVKTLEYKGGSTNTSHAIGRSALYLFERSMGARGWANKMLLLVTDGQSDSPMGTLRTAKRLRDKGAIIIVLSVGEAVDHQECRGIAGCDEVGTCDRHIDTNWQNVSYHAWSILEAACKELPKDGVCSEWSDYGPCEGECGKEGRRRSTRYEIAPPEVGLPPCPTCRVREGRSCSFKNGGLERSLPCTPKPCVVNAGCGEWGQWSGWSTTCGNSHRKREREGYNNPPASGGGLDCVEQSPPKSQYDTQTSELSPCPVHQTPGPWAEWSECSATCGGGKRTRTREGIPEEGELYGGQNLEKQGVPYKEEETCSENACPVDATCGEWTPWSECDRDCGGGLQKRERTPWLDNAEHGGRSCEVQHPEGKEMVNLCNTHPCPVYERAGEWMDWGPCSEQCGAGVQTRHRGESVQKAAHGGLTIAEQNKDMPYDQQIKLSEERTCREAPCGPCTLPWSPWSACPKCSGTRHRETMVAYDFEDKLCELPTNEVESCEGHCTAEKEEIQPPFEPFHLPEPNRVPSDGDGGQNSDDSGDDGDKKSESGTFPTAAVAGGIIGGIAVLGAIGGGAAYSMKSRGRSAPHQTVEVEGDDGVGSMMEEEKESLINSGDQAEMWAA